MVILKKAISQALGLQHQNPDPQEEKTGNSLFLKFPQDLWSNIIELAILEGVCSVTSGVKATAHLKNKR